MNPLHLIARNYRTFADLEIDFPEGCVAVLGENGAGKSSIVNAIDLAIFGPESRSLADCHAEEASEDLLLEVEFEHARAHYRVRRTYNARGRGKTTLDFEALADYGADDFSGWVPLTRESVKETQALIEQTIGLSRDTFRASAFLAQGDGAAFTEAQPRDRKRILAEVLGVDRWERLLAAARADKNQLLGRDVALAARLEAALPNAEAVPDVTLALADQIEAETVHADNVADLERAHAELVEQYQAARAQSVMRSAALTELKAATAEAETLRDRETKAAEARRQLDETRGLLGRLPAPSDTATLRARQAELSQQIAAHGEAVRERDFAQRLRDQREREALQHLQRAADHDHQAADLRLKASHLQDHDDAVCQTCGQTLPDDARARAIASYTTDAAAQAVAGEAERAAAAKIEVPLIPDAPPPPPRDELATVAAQLEEISAHEKQRATLTERIRLLEITAVAPDPEALIAAAEAALAKQARLVALGEPADLDAIQAQGASVSRELEHAQQQLSVARTMKTRLEERLATATDAARQVDQISRDRGRLQQELDVILGLERAFSPNGIPALIIENSAIPYLETEATRILGELGTSYRVELRTQAELKSGDGLRDTLDVVVFSETGERTYESYSGGEQTRINLALRIALARLLAHRRGAESRLLVVDEPDGLDDQGMAALVEVLRSLETDFDKLYIVSHVPGLRDSFDTTLTVEKQDGRSSVVEAGVFEQVPA